MVVCFLNQGIRQQPNALLDLKLFYFNKFTYIGIHVFQIYVFNFL